MPAAAGTVGDFWSIQLCEKIERATLAQRAVISGKRHDFNGRRKPSEARRQNLGRRQ